MEEALELLFQTALHGAQWGTCTLVYNASEHVIHDQIRTTMLRRKNDKQVGKTFRAYKAAEVFVKILVRSDEFLAPIASFIRMRTLATVVNQSKDDVFKITFMGARAKKAQKGCTSQPCAGSTASYEYQISSWVSYKPRTSRLCRKCSCTYTVETEQQYKRVLLNTVKE